MTPSTLLQPVMRPKAAVALLFLALLLVEYATSATAKEEVTAPMGRGLLQGGGVNRKVGKTFRPAAKPKSKDKPSRRCAHGGCGGSRKLFTLVEHVISMQKGE